MIRNYFTTAIRSLKGNIQFTVLNILGLSIGIACCMIIGLFVLNQLKYDQHHEHAKRLYRVVNKQVEGTKESYVAMTQGPMAPELVKSFTEVEAATRVEFIHNKIQINDKDPFEDKLMAVDESYFSMFTAQFIVKPTGNIISPEGILISESASKKLFGNNSPIGEVITVLGLGDFKVTGLYKDFPFQSHLYSEYIISFEWIEKSQQQYAQSWSYNSYYNYVLLKNDTDIEAFNSKLNTFVHKFVPASWNSFTYFLQPILKIQWQGGYVGNPRSSFGKILLIGFSMVGLIILMLASFNYMNLATARSAKRAMEVGVRKVMGAVRSQLIGQFLMESFLLCTAGFLLAILWADLGLSLFNAFTGSKLDLKDLFAPENLVWIIAANFLLALLAGSYPAFFLSRFMPVAVMKGQKIQDSSRRLRKGIVIVQFTLTSLLVILVLVVFKQTDFMRSYDLGFNKEHLIIFQAEPLDQLSHESFKAEFSKIPGVKKVASTSNITGWSLNNTNLRSTASQEEESIKTDWLFSDHNYIPTMELQLLAGRNFNDNGNDEDKGVILNEKAAGALGWRPEEAIGKRVVGFIFKDSLPGEIIGVIKDFHASSLRREINPMVIGYGTTQNVFIMRVETTDMPGLRKKINELGTKLTKSEKEFEALFLDDALELAYQGETKIAQVLSFFTLLALFIGCSGLYALSAYEGEQRIKELSIRKIMGASTLQLLLLLSQGFLKLISLSTLISIPIAYYLANIWLRSYAYHIPWSIELLVQATGSIILIGWLTIAAQGLKAARLNPVDALKIE